MSDEKKPLEMTATLPVTPTAKPVSSESAVSTVDAPPSVVPGAMVGTADAPPAPVDLSVPGAEELKAWNEQVRRRMRQQTRRSFLGSGAGMVAGLGALAWLVTRREIDGISWPFRKALATNEQLARDYFNTGRQAPTFDASRAVEDRVNGDVGLGDDFDAAAWKLQVQGLASQDEPQALSIDDIKKLPRVEMTTEFKCIEGWSVIVSWAGARFTDFMRAYPPETVSGDALRLDRPEDLPPYVGMATPDGEYYVGLDMESLLHPQTLLAYEMNGAPLTNEHGVPLRLVTPVKYGVKNIKRLGTIRYSTRRSADYWAERGYDWYVGL